MGSWCVDFYLYLYLYQEQSTPQSFVITSMIAILEGDE